MGMSVGMARASANAAEPCGDLAGSWCDGDRTVIALADGLGHGAEAAVAAGRAVDYVGRHLGEEPLALFAGMHQALASTRGAAVAVAVIDPAEGRLTYTAVGNTRAGVFGWRTSRLDGYAGVVGVGYRRLAPVAVPFRPGDTLALWSDGVDERMTLALADGLDAAELARQALAGFASGADDACVVVARMDSR